MEISYHEPFGAIYDQVFPGASSWCGVSEAMLDGFSENGEKIYTFYPAGEEITAEERNFMNVCKDNGIDILERKDSIQIVEDYAAEKGYDIDILNIEANAVEWTDL